MSAAACASESSPPLSAAACAAESPEPPPWSAEELDAAKKKRFANDGGLPPLPKAKSMVPLRCNSCGVVVVLAHLFLLMKRAEGEETWGGQHRGVCYECSEVFCNEDDEEKVAASKRKFKKLCEKVWTSIRWDYTSHVRQARTADWNSAQKRLDKAFPGASNTEVRALVKLASRQASSALRMA